MSEPFFPAPEPVAGRIHVWRRDRYATRYAPATGYYAVRKQTEFLRRGEAFPKGLVDGSR